MAAAANLMVTLFIARSEDTSSTRPGGYSPDLYATGQKRPVGSWKHFWRVGRQSGCEGSYRVVLCRIDWQIR
jgi:hypothetical protein